MNLKLTKRLVEALEPGTGDYFIWDTEILGFGVRIYPPGSRGYLLQIRFRGRSRRFRIGLHGTPWTTETSRREALRRLGLTAAGIDPEEEKLKPLSSMTVGALMDQYFDEGCRTKKPRTIKEEKSLSKRHIKPNLGRRNVAGPKKHDIEVFMAKVAKPDCMIDEKIGPRARAIVRGGKGAANRSKNLLSSALSLAVEIGLRPDNPAFGVKRFKVPPRERFLSAEEFKRLGQALTEAEAEGVNRYPIAAIRVLILSGARMSEILDLQRSWVDFQAGGVRLPDSKTGARFLVLGRPALDIIKNVLTLHDRIFVFPDRTGTKPYAGVKKIWRDIRKRADLQDVRLHDLRHSFASVGVLGGASLFMVGKILGHSDAATTQRYAHLADSPVKAAADEISEVVSRALEI